MYFLYSRSTQCFFYYIRISLSDLRWLKSVQVFLSSVPLHHSFTACDRFHAFWIVHILTKTLKKTRMKNIDFSWRKLCLKICFGFFSGKKRWISLLSFYLTSIYSMLIRNSTGKSKVCFSKKKSETYFQAEFSPRKINIFHSSFL